jgi:branched-chain amino acid aminotransferase
MNSQLAKMESITNGYDEGIMLDYQGMVSEGRGENVFVVLDGVIYTPPISSSLLSGLTRDSVITLADEMDLEVRQQQIPREMLYISDEVFLTGTAAEVTPVRSVDKIIVGKGFRGRITKDIQETFFAVVNGSNEDKYKWLTFVK